MKSFLSRFHSLVLFTLTGFDRLRFCGESRLLNHARGVQSYCHQQRILFKNFPSHAEALTYRLRQQTALQLGDVPLQYLNSPDVDKEAAALDLAQRHGRCQGRSALLSCLESGLTYRLRKNSAGLIEPRKEKTRCLHYYHYFQHEQLGLCYVRIQSWFPFTVCVGLKGRRWLAQQLHNRNVDFQQRGNWIRQVEDVAFNSPKEYKVFRTKEGEPSNAAKSRQQLRKGVADSLAGVAQPDALGDLLKPLGQAVVTEGRRRARALNPLTGADGDRLRLLAQGDYLINGFRNRDLRESILGPGVDAAQRRRQSAQIARWLALLQGHGLILRVQKTHRYQLTAHGRRVVTALLSAHGANVAQLAAAA